MLYPLEHVRHHQNPLADTPALASCQAPQLGRPRFAAKEVCWHRPSPKHGMLSCQLYHIWGPPEAGIITPKRVQKLQMAWHAKAKAEAGYRFYALYDKISRDDILAHAYAQCRSNKSLPLRRQLLRRRLNQQGVSRAR